MPYGGGAVVCNDNQVTLRSFSVLLSGMVLFPVTKTPTSVVLSFGPENVFV